MTTHNDRIPIRELTQELTGRDRAGYQFYIEPEVHVQYANPEMIFLLSRESRLRVKLSISRFPGGSFIIHKFHRSVLRGGL